MIFNVLSAESAATFVRAMFPRFYLLGALLNAIACVLALLGGATYRGAVSMAVAVSFVYLREHLTPTINALRDEQLQRGDKAAGKRFNTLHALSEKINYGQFVIYVALIGYGVFK